MKNKQLLWIGCWEDSKEFENKVKKGYKLGSAQVSQSNLIYGIEDVSGLSFDSINGCVVPNYPTYKDKYVDEVIWSHNNDSFDISVGFKNLKYINRITCTKSMLIAAKKWINGRYEKNKDLIILVYSMRSSSMKTACYIKKKIPSAKIYLIITDLPQFMDIRQNFVKKILKKMDWINIKYMQSRFDGFILYASKMADFLNVSDDKWILMEGSYDLKDNIKVDNIKKEKAIMYSGNLDKAYGIEMLLDAFSEIEDKDIELWLTGGGNAEDMIQEYAKKDPRIKYLGFLPSRKDVLILQKRASLLINMRMPTEDASNYCFPSKLFEYMVTETPVITFKLGGIPDEYYNYLITVDDVSVSSLKDAIIESLSIPENKKNELGRNASEFILNKKNSSNQCSLIWRFINEK